jgi:hypothetical protein
VIEAQWRSRATDNQKPSPNCEPSIVQVAAALLKFARQEPSLLRLTCWTSSDGNRPRLASPLWYPRTPKANAPSPNQLFIVDNVYSQEQRQHTFQIVRRSIGMVSVTPSPARSQS